MNDKPTIKKMKHFLRISDFSAEEITKIIKFTLKLKQTLKLKDNHQNIFKNKSLAMIFEKPSLRTRVSFEVGMTQLGGHAVYLGPDDIQMGKRESLSDIAGTLSRYVDLIIARVFRHKTIEELAENSTVPVINALSDLEHPCQIMSDMVTITEYKKDLNKLKLAFVGDGENNITHSLAMASGILGIDFRVANPKGFSMKKEIIGEAKKLTEKSGGKITETFYPELAVENADVVYTDTWISMGDERQKEKRIRVFKNFQVTKKLMNIAKPDAIFMHDMPAYRGNEVESAVINGPQSVIFDQAENRLHTQKAIMQYLLHNF